jgi:hypothetical protein
MKHQEKEGKDKRRKQLYMSPFEVSYVLCLNLFCDIFGSWFTFSLFCEDYNQCPAC